MSRPWSSVSLFAALVAFRLINAFTIATFFQPDEYFQSLEPAWKIAFGPESGAWITWEWRERLRSSVHPLIFGAAYRAADRIGDLVQASVGARSTLLLGAPKVLQAIFAAAGDFYTLRLAFRVYGNNSVPVRGALLLTVVSPWQWFCSVRTLSNSLETVLTILGLYYWPWTWFLSLSEDKRTSHSSSSLAANALYISLTAAAFACILRPTNIIIWATVAISSSLQSGDARKAMRLLQSSLLCGPAILALSLGLDRSYYGDWTFPPLKFLYVNLVQSLAVFYGRNRTDYYFTEGLPLLLTTSLPLAGVGLYQALRRHPIDIRSPELENILFTLALAILTTVFTFTTIAHKEVRFVYPLLPLLHIIAARPLSQLYLSCSTRILSFVAVPALVINCLLALYLTRVHQSGVIGVLHHLRHTHESQLIHNASALTSVAFLMPCHSTPWRSHLIHSSIAAWALTCEPPLGIPVSERGTYMDEADEFYADPKEWMRENISIWPEKVVMFAQLEPLLRGTLEGKGYAECWRGFNSHWHDDWRRKGDVVVWCAGGETTVTG